ncbi:MAG: phosphate-starvation-inducible PsiE family protein [Desulfobulbaceae bacterium]|nr:phosphate-starvation-inducible PsiE family protein [Desulfobulbaceae bacterium]
MKNEFSDLSKIILGDKQREPLLHHLHNLIKLGVRILAILMALIIFWGIGDVVWVTVQRLQTPPVMILKINDILYIFGAFLAVLIAIEIYENIIMYLRQDVIHVQLVVATALMAIARKVIVFDFKEIKAEFILGTASVILALGVTYWLISKKNIEMIPAHDNNDHAQFSEKCVHGKTENKDIRSENK